MQILLAIMITTLLSFYNTAHANEISSCEAPVLKTGEYQLNGREGYVCGVRVGHGENSSLVVIYFSTGELDCKVELPSRNFEKQTNAFGNYVNTTKSQQIIVLDDRSFLIEGVQSNTLLYVKKGF